MAQSIVQAEPPQLGHGVFISELWLQSKAQTHPLSPAMIKHSCQPMQPGKVIKTKHAVNPSSLGATAPKISTHLCRRRRKEIPCVGISMVNKHIWSPLTSLSGKNAGTKWKQKPFLIRPIKSDNCLVVDAREILNILAETAAFSRWESAYIVFMQTFPHLVCNHPFTAKQCSVIANSLLSCEFKILPLPKIKGISITLLPEMKEVDASLTI